MDCHPTADALYERVRQRLPRISLATVYRNLDLLAQDQLVQKLEHFGPQRRYDGNLRPHYHVSCQKCGCLGDITPPSLTIPLEQAQKLTDFTLLSFDLEFHGLCPACQGKNIESGQCRGGSEETSSENTD